MLSLTRRRAAKAKSAGQKAEQRVDRAARQYGWQRVAANYQARCGELDRVYLGGGTLIVVEVRYRSRNDFGRAAETVTHAKQQRIIRATRLFLLQHSEYADYPVRFDVVGVNSDKQLDWIDNAFAAD